MSDSSLSKRRLRRLDEHMALFPGQCMRVGTYASRRFDQLYLSWIQARWVRGRPRAFISHMALPSVVPAEVNNPCDGSTPSRATMRLNIKAILRDPKLRRELMVTTIIAIQAREGITTTREQAEAAYDVVQKERG